MKTAAFILVSVFVLFFLLGQLSLIDPDEGRYAGSAWEMVKSGQYLIPTLNADLRINKPVLFYWAVALSYKIFGINEFAARFPSALSGLILIISLYFFAKKERKSGPFIPAFVLLSSPIFLIISGIAITDMLFTALVTFAVFSFYLGSNNKKFNWAFFIFAGLSLATKGPVGVLLILITAVVFSIVEKDKIYMKSFFNIRGLLLTLFIGGAWYLILFFKIGSAEFIELVKQETLDRFHGGFVHREPFWYYIPVIIVGFLPWSLFFFKFKLSDLKTRLSRFSLTYIFVALIFFSLCKSKLATYILSIFPFLSLIIAYSIERSWNKKTNIGLVFFFILSILSALLLFVPSDIVASGVQISFRSVSLGIFLIAAPLLIVFKKELKIQFPFLCSTFILIYFYLLLFYGGAFSNYRSTENLFKGQDIALNTVYTYRFFKPSIIFYARARVEEINSLEDLKGDYLVIAKKDILDLKQEIEDFEIIADTDKYMLIKVQKLQK
jgi:4-amino-4-deoxy-L-arabinose transferase-like glycosyltransferase